METPKPDDKKDEGIVVFSILKPSKCSECNEELAAGSFLRMEQEKPFCLSCADLDELVYLHRGNVALTRRARKYSGLSAIVLKFSRSRGRYERQGVLVEPAALERAELECLSDEDQREAARERAALQRERADAKYIQAFAQQLLARYPGCPAKTAETISSHACKKYSGRVGRSAAAKQFDPDAIDLAVRAHVRHTKTNYDSLLASGIERHEARFTVAGKVDEIMARWRTG